MSAAQQILHTLIEAGIDIGLTADGGIELIHDGQLTDGHRQAIRACKPDLVELLRQSQEAANDALLNFFHVTAPWRQPAKDYQQHANACPHCAAAGKGYGHRCPDGQALWRRYNDAISTG